MLAADPGRLEAPRPDRLVPSTDAVPERFELGTLPYELLAGAHAAVALDAHEERLRLRREEGLRRIQRIRMYSNAVRRTPTAHDL